MKISKKKILIAMAAIFVLILLAGGWLISNTLPIGTGHAAKTLCSNIFVANRDPAAVFREEIAPVHFLFSLVDSRVNREEKTVTASSLGFVKTKAIYRDGCGCTIVEGITEKELRRQTFMNVGSRNRMKTDRKNLPWPEGYLGPAESLPTGIDADKLDQALDAAFSEPGPEAKRLTRAVLVIYDGELIAERYAPGFDENTPFLGWSMSKSVINALMGILVRQKNWIS